MITAFPKRALRGSVARARAGPAARLERAPAHATLCKAKFGLPEACNQPKAKVQPDGVQTPCLKKTEQKRKIERAVGPTFFHSAAACLHVPAKLTPETTKHEARKRRANERHVVGCCEVLARS